jgi:hypothetical protein
MQLRKTKIEYVGLQRQENNFIVQCNFTAIDNITFYRTSNPNFYVKHFAVAIFRIKTKQCS